VEYDKSVKENGILLVNNSLGNVKETGVLTMAFKKCKFEK
jgi:hypothetical protein